MNQNPQNIKEFVKLMNKYESLTLEEIKSEWKKILSAFAGDDDNFDVYETEEKALKSLHKKLDN